MATPRAGKRLVWSVLGALLASLLLTLGRFAADSGSTWRWGEIELVKQAGAQEGEGAE
jgi:hypothetical protein